jgi:acyl-CoA thioester hydrolase
MSGIAITIPVLWGDMDAFGHVNNTRFFRWFESARIALCEAIGIATTIERQGAGAPTGATTTIAPILATTTCDFVAPVHYPGSVRVGARVTRVGETSVTMEYVVEDAATTDRVHARGSSVVVLVDYATMTKVRVPPEVRSKIDTLA